MAARKRTPTSDEGRSSGKKPIRTFTDWTYSRIRSAESMADSGHLSEAVRVCDWLLGDLAVSGALETRRDAILGLTPTFEPSGDKRRSKKAVKALEAGDDYWAAFPETELGQLIIWRQLLGIGFGRQPWTDPDPDHGGRVLPALEFWHPTGLRYDFKLATWFGKDANEREFEIVPGDGTWVGHSLAKFHAWMNGAWRKLSRFALLKYLATQDLSQHSEKAAMLVATSTKTSTAEQRKALAADLARAGDDMIAVLQDGFDIKLVEVRANTEQIYNSQIEMADKAITTYLLGGNLSTNGDKNGSKAAAETQVKAGQLPRLRADCEGLSTTLHDQSLTWWAEFNFGDSGLAPWPVYPTQPEEDKKSKADTANTIFDAVGKADKMGFEIDTDVLVEDYGLTWITGRTKPEPPPAPALLPAPDGQPKQEPPAPANKRALGQASKFTTLLSGALTADNQGFVNGQLYADALAETSLEHGQKALQPTLDAILEELDAATSYDDLRDRLRARYQTLDATELSDLMYRTMMIADLAGRTAVNEDA
jgi:hypothetical protein